MKFNLLALVTIVWLSACGGGSSGESDQSTPSEANDTQEEVEVVEESNQDGQTAVMEAGKKVYDQYCIVCHQADGAGVPNAFPPLIQTDWVLGDKDRLITVVLKGLTGEIEVNGETYNSAMTPHDFLSDQEVADVLTYVRGSFGNDAGAVTAEEVATVRAAQ